MAHSISLSDGVTTVALNSGDYSVTRYHPQTPSPGTNLNQQGAGDYALNPYNYQDVTESIDLLIQGSDIADLQGNVRAIQTLLETGRRRQGSGMGARLFLIVQWSGEAAAWRSEVPAGRLLLDDAGFQVSRLKVEATLMVTRRYFWEANSETQLSMTSSETTVAATTVVLYNDDDASSVATNYINIAAAQVTGALPTPVRLLLTNAEVSALGWSDFYIANTVFCDPANYSGFLRGSVAVSGATHAWATNPEEAAWRWNLTDAALTRLGGRYFRVILALSSASSNVYFRPEVQATTLGLTLYKGKQVLGNAGDLYDLGAVPIPPGGYNLVGTDIDLVIDVQKVGGGTVIADFASLMPAQQGCFVKLTQLGFSTPTDEGIELNGPEGTVYYVSGALHWPIVRQEGGPLFLWPGIINKLRVLYRTSDWSGAVGKKLNAQAFVRERRLDI